MTKAKLKRSQILQLAGALNVCRMLDVPSRFRYAIEKNLTSLRGEIEAFGKAWPEPVLKGGDGTAQTLEEFQIKHDEWEKSISGPLEEEVDVDLYLTDIVEINDTVNVKGDADRFRQNQALVAALMPIWKG